MFYSDYLYESSANFYTSNWPQSYQEDTAFDCTIKIDEGGIKKLIFMDLDLKKTSLFSCNQYIDDYVDIRGIIMILESMIS